MHLAGRLPYVLANVAHEALVQKFHQAPSTKQSIPRSMHMFNGSRTIGPELEEGHEGPLIHGLATGHQSSTRCRAQTTLNASSAFAYWDKIDMDIDCWLAWSNR